MRQRQFLGGFLQASRKIFSIAWDPPLPPRPPNTIRLGSQPNLFMANKTIKQSVNPCMRFYFPAEGHRKSNVGGSLVLQTQSCSDDQQ